MNQKKVLKDVNFLQIKREMKGKLIELGKNHRDEIVTVIQKDAEFLMKHNIMDYSLLLTIEQHVKTDPLKRFLLEEQKRSSISST